MLKPDGYLYNEFAQRPASFFDECRERAISQLKNTQFNYDRFEVIIVCRMWSAFADGFDVVAWQAVEDILTHSPRAHHAREVG